MRINGLRFLFTLCGEMVHVGVEVANGFVQFANVNVLGIQIGAQLLQLLILLIQLLHQIVDGGLELRSF